MKGSIKFLSTMVLVLVLLTGLVSGQSLEERLSSMVSTNAEMYINPLATAFGSGMNSGWYHSAKPHKMLGFDFGVKAMAVTFPDEQKMFDFDISQLSTYDFSTSFDINAGGFTQSYSINMSAADLYPNTDVPTIFGDDEGVDVRATEDQLVDIIETQLIDQGVPEASLSSVSSDIDAAAAEALNVVPPLVIAGTGLDMLPLAVPQAAIGLSVPMLPIKAEIVLRGVPEIDLGEDFGTFNFFGVGGKIALDPFIPIPMFPVNVSVGAFTQKMALGDVFEANNTLVSLMVGKNINVLLFGVGVYGAVGMETSSIEIGYDYEYEDSNGNPVVEPLTFEFKGENKSRVSVGGSVRLAIFNLSADYSVGADNVFTAGLGISIR